jgi:DNA polymerase-3 subunit gamma/tau
LEFRLLGAETLHDLLEAVNASAGLELDEEALEAAVRRGRGSARDALSALDQVVAAGSTDAARPELASVVDALAEADVSKVLVALSAMLAGGWGPQQLATELIDDLRQIFLAALAPELCTVTGPSLDRFVSLAEAMGLPRVVRTIEILGHALVDMRDAPDAQVVLEITVVRAVRPDLDSDLEALTDRVSALERSLTGAAAFPRPAAGPASVSASASSASPAASEADARSSAPASAPAKGGAASEEVGSRPSLGAVQRKKAAAVKPDPEVASVPSSSDPASVVGPQPSTADSAEPVVDARKTADAPSSGGEVVDRDSLTEAWGDSILRALPARAKALFSAGRFVSVDEKGAHFALPNAAHRDRCAEMVGTVEQKLGAHFGTPVTLILDVDDSVPPGGGAGAAPVRPSGSPSAGGVGGVGGTADTDDDASEYADYAEEADAVDTGEQALEAEARLLQAFPGASEVSG